MALIGHSSFARGKVHGSDRLLAIGERHGKSPEQVALRWLIQQEGVIAIPKTSDEDHCRQNFQIFDFQLSQAGMREISDLVRPDGRLVDPDELAPDWD